MAPGLTFAFVVILAALHSTLYFILIFRIMITFNTLIQLLILLFDILNYRCIKYHYLLYTTIFVTTMALKDICIIKASVFYFSCKKAFLFEYVF
jgi:hypothetical protein